MCTRCIQDWRPDVRVAIFTDNDFGKVNGVTTTLMALLSHAPADIQPRIYTADAHGCESPTYLSLRSLGMPIPYYGEMRMYLPRARQYLRRVLEDGVDVLHLTTPGPMGVVALWVAARTRLPLLGSFHTDLEAYTTMLSGRPGLGRLMGSYMRWMYRRCRKVLAPSEATRGLLTASGLPADRIGLWTRGVDTTLFTPERRSARLREMWGVSHDRPAILFVGRLSREKGLECLPAVSRRLSAAGVRHRLIIAGDGPLGPWLRERCADAMFTGFLGREAVAEVFASADLFVFPSRTDTAGNVVLEAQAAGLPVVVSDAGGPRENIAVGESGLVCAGTSIDSWASAVAALLRDRVRREQMTRAARTYALSRQWEVALASVFNAYRSAAVDVPLRQLSVDHAA